MNFQCENKADCFCDPNPLSTLNFSSEIPDLNEFLGIEWYFPPPWIGNPGPGTANQPPCVCFAAESQEAADLCAKRCSYIPGNPGPPTAPNPPGGPNGFPTRPSPLFFNTAQSCQHTCPDGSMFTFTVPAGSFISYNQALSDDMAHSLACKRANDLHICFIPPLDHICVNQPYTSAITVPLATAPITFTITSGSLPPGLTDSTSVDGTTFLIEGTPTVAGTYPFTLMAVDTLGNTMVGNYTIRVLGITNITSLPNAVENVAYSTQLNAVGGTAPFVFTVVLGTIPGIMLSSSGLLSGTPDYLTAGSYPITVNVVNSEGDSCSFEGTVVINQAPGPDWISLIWDVYNLDPGTGPPNSASGVGSARQATAVVDYNGVGPPFPGVTPVHAFAPAYTGGPFTVRVTVSLAASAGAFGDQCFRILRNGIPQAPTRQSGTCFGCTATVGNGVCVIEWDFPAGVADLYTIDDASPGNTFLQLFGVGSPGNASLTFSIFNV